MENEKVTVLTDKDLSKLALGGGVFTPKGVFKANSIFDKGDVVYCGYSLYASLVDNNQALLSDTSAWAVLINGDTIKTAIDNTNKLHEDIKQLKEQTDNIYSQENNRVTQENQRALTFNKLVDNFNTLIATASDNERSRSDTFNKNERARQKDWYDQLTADHEQYTKLWEEIKKNYNDFADGATLNESSRQTIFNELKLAIDNLKIEAASNNEQTKTVLANAQTALTNAQEAETKVEGVVKSATDAATKANNAATKVNDGVDAAKQALDKANAAITTANNANTVATESKEACEAAANKANQAATKAETVAEHAPYIDADGYYHKYDATTNSFVKTNTNLKGDKGDKGDIGENGINGSDATVTKEAVEKVLTGNITSHTHDQYINKNVGVIYEEVK